MIKVVAILALGPASIEMDARGYWDLSALVMESDILMMGDPIAYRTPAYPWFLAVVRTVFGDPSLFSIVVLQGVMAVATIGIAAKIAEVVTGSPLALPLTFLVAMPAVSAIVYSATVLTESLFTFLMMLNFLVVLIYDRRKTSLNAFLVGLTFAMTLLTRPIVMYLWIAHLIFVLLKPRDLSFVAEPASLATRQRFLHVGVAALTVAVCLSPWIIRNEKLFGSPFVTEFLGRNLWIVTFQDESGAALDLPETSEAADLKQRIGAIGLTDQWRSTWIVSNALVASGLSDPEADRLMKQVAFDAMKADPSRCVYKTIRRTANFWRCAVTDLPAQGLDSGLYQGQRTWSYQLEWIRVLIDNRLSRAVWINTLIATVAALSVIMLIVQPDTSRFGVWIGLILGYFSVVTGIVEIPNYRYRIVLEPLVAAAISSAAIVLLSILRKKNSRVNHLH